MGVNQMDMKQPGIIDRSCGLCGGKLEDRDGVGPCKACWTIQVAHTHISEQVAQSLMVMAEYRCALEIVKTIPVRAASMSSREEDRKAASRLDILHDYGLELSSLRALRARQRELRMKLDLRLNLKGG